MKIFIGQAVSGQDLEKLYKEMEKIYTSLEEHEYYCTLQEDEEEFSKKTKSEMLQHAFEEIDKSDALLAIVRSEHRSEGLLIEIGYVMATGKKLIVAVQNDVKNTYLRELADQVIEYTNIDDLVEKLKEIK
jgi:nucleoside 2-deoxyribosyltransferase